MGILNVNKESALVYFIYLYRYVFSMIKMRKVNGIIAYSTKIIQLLVIISENVLSLTDLSFFKFYFTIIELIFSKASLRNRYDYVQLNIVHTLYTYRWTYHDCRAFLRLRIFCFLICIKTYRFCYCPFLFGTVNSHVIKSGR